MQKSIVDALNYVQAQAVMAASQGDTESLLKWKEIQAEFQQNKACFDAMLKG